MNQLCGFHFARCKSVEGAGPGGRPTPPGLYAAAAQLIKVRGSGESVFGGSQLPLLLLFKLGLRNL